MLVLATHIFAPSSRLESLVRFCHACIDLNEQPTPTFISSSLENLGLGQSITWFNQLTTELLLCVFRQLSSHTDIRSIFHLLGEHNEFHRRFEPLFALLDEQPSPVPFDWALVLYTDRCYRSIMTLIEELIKHDRFDLVDQLVICVDIEIDMILFERFKCSFDEYKHNQNTTDKELSEAFESMCQEHQDVLKRLKKPLLYGDFLLSIRSNSSKLVRVLLLIFTNQAQHLPEPYVYSSTNVQQGRLILDKLWTALVNFIHEFQDRPIVRQVLEYMVSLFSSSVLDQLANEKLIPEDYDDYLRIFEELDNDEEIIEEEQVQPMIIAENEFEAALLKNVFTTTKVTSVAETIATSASTGKQFFFSFSIRFVSFLFFVLEKNPRRASSRASSSSQVLHFGTVSSRRSSSSFTGSTVTVLHHLSDKDLRLCLNIIQDTFLRFLAPELAFQLATKFRMTSYNLLVFSYAHRLYLNLLMPSDIRTRFEQLPQINPSGKSDKKRLTNVLRTMTATIPQDQQTNSIVEQKQILIERLLSRTSADDRLIAIIFNLFKISRLFRIDSAYLLNTNTHNDQWIILQRLLSYPASSFPSKIKLAGSFTSLLKLSKAQVDELIVDETDRTLERWQKNEPTDDYHCWPFEPNNTESYNQFISLLYEKNYDAVGKELIERSKTYEEKFNNLENQDPSSPYLRLRIELLIYANTCFINACHMEGICIVLEHARHLCYMLNDIANYQLLIRLLLGLQQYSEMIYAFDLLFQSEQFDNLLTTISQINDERLNAALFDYIKRYHPTDEHTFTSISMNLNMHHELAMMYRDAGEKLLKTSQFTAQSSTVDMSVSLQSLLQYYSDAADTYFLAGCCRQSEQCLRQARIISLQLEFLRQQPILILLNLNSKQVRDLLPKFDRCWDAFIVADAYGEHTMWPQCLVDQFICNKSSNAFNYWNEFQRLIPVDDQFVGALGRILSKKTLNTIAVKNFQEVLEHIDDISSLNRLQQLLISTDNNFSNIFTSIDSPYVLDSIRITS
mgnify:FL=1